MHTGSQIKTPIKLSPVAGASTSAEHSVGAPCTALFSPNDERESTGERRLDEQEPESLGPVTLPGPPRIYALGSSGPLASVLVRPSQRTRPPARPQLPVPSPAAPDRAKGYRAAYRSEGDFAGLVVHNNSHW